MRKVFSGVLILLSAAMLLTGCDFFRRLAGRPTSSEIEAKREAIARKVEAEKAMESSADTIPTVEVPAMEAAQPEAAAPVKTASASGSKKRFYIVIATFSTEENARKCIEKMAQRGYPGEILGFKGGYSGVGICGTDDEQEAREMLKKIKGQDFCPEGVWILDRNKR